MTPEQVHERIKIVNGEKVFEGHLNVSYKKLTSLEPYNLSDIIVTGYFWCSYNKLTSLKGAPKQVGRNFFCYGNKLTSLEGLPESIGGYICIKKEVLQKLYSTNPLVALYTMKNKFYFV